MANVLTRRLLIKRPVNIFEYCSLTTVSSNHIIKNVFYHEHLKSYPAPNPKIYFDHAKTTLYLVQRNFLSSDKRDDNVKEKECKNEEKKLTLFQKFKQMYRDYWYVLVPVHLVTSAAWFGGFYYMAKSGVDIVALLESWHVSDKLITPLKDSSMGYIAVAYALYKIATPARYTVTIGGTTISINYLKKWGYIKPVPSTEQMKKIYQEKKVNLTKSMQETKGNILEKTDNLIESIQEKKEEIKEKKDNILKTVKKSTGNSSRSNKTPKVTLKTKGKT